MDLWQADVEDMRPTLTEERTDLLRFLGRLTPSEWTRPTAVPGWTVKDLALHLLDDDLGWLSRGRDDDSTGLLDMSNHGSFVAALAAKNQRWIDGAQGLSRDVVAGLLRWSGGQIDTYYAGLDLQGRGWVSWASDAAVPQWFDIAQDLTERWVHQQQMREAVGHVDEYRDRYLRTVLRTFIWAVPHQYRVLAPEGTTVAIDLSSGGQWTVHSDGSGRWNLSQDDVHHPSAWIAFDDEAGWRWLTGAALPEGGVRADGAPRLLDPLLSVRGIIA